MQCALCTYCSLGPFFKKIYLSQVLKEYQTVMKPVATALNTLQKETNIFYGVLLPTLSLLKRELQEVNDSGLVYAGPLVEALLEQAGDRRGFENRHVMSMSCILEEMFSVLTMP